MKFMTLLSIELTKIRRSKIILILFIAVVILWIPSVANAHLNFKMSFAGISPENNFLIQGLMGMAWFMFPASMVVCTVLLAETERGHNGIIKMKSLPINLTTLCLAKFVVLLLLAASEMALTMLTYFISASIASHLQNYDFLLPVSFVLKEIFFLLLSAIPMLAVFWLLSTCIQTPIFCVGTGLASIVPSILLINTKIWFLYPMAYPFYVVATEYAKLSTSMTESNLNFFLWLPIAIIITGISLWLSCRFFEQTERS